MRFALSLLLLQLGTAPPPPTPGPCAAKENAFLRSLVGEWDVDAEFRAGADGWEKAAGRASIASELEGCVLVQHYRGTRGGDRWEFLAVLGASGTDRPIQELFVHSQHGVMSLSAGAISGGTLTVEDRPTVKGAVVRIQHVYSNAGPGGFRYESRRSTDGGRTWAVAWRATYRKARNR